MDQNTSCLRRRMVAARRPSFGRPIVSFDYRSIKARLKMRRRNAFAKGEYREPTEREYSVAERLALLIHEHFIPKRTIGGWTIPTGQTWRRLIDGKWQYRQDEETARRLRKPKCVVMHHRKISTGSMTPELFSRWYPV
jgi:hypothetical protein